MDGAFLAKNKKIIWIALAVAVVFSLFFIKTKSAFKNKALEESGLSYNNQTINDLVNQDTDADGIFDWEESLWGTDPKKTDTDDDGIPDIAEINKLKAVNVGSEPLGTNEEEKLTQTDKFSRELFSTVSALNQTGALDQDTVEKLSSTLIKQIENPATKKVYSYTDIKTVSDDTTGAAKKYSDDLDVLFRKYPTLSKNGYEGVSYSISTSFIDVMQKYLVNPDDASGFSKFDPIYKEINGMIEGMKSINVPIIFSLYHLNLMNGLEKVAENLNDMKLINSDTIVAMGAISKYQENVAYLQASFNKIKIIINQKLNY